MVFLLVTPLEPTLAGDFSTVRAGEVRYWKKRGTVCWAEN